MRDKLLKLIRSDLESKSFAKLADEIGMPVTTLRKLVSGERKTGRLDTWERVISHYGTKCLK